MRGRERGEEKKEKPPRKPASCPGKRPPLRWSRKSAPGFGTSVDATARVATLFSCAIERRKRTRGNREGGERGSIDVGGEGKEGKVALARGWAGPIANPREGQRDGLSMEKPRGKLATKREER